jgi:hypothetical protein
LQHKDFGDRQTTGKSRAFQPLPGNVPGNVSVKFQQYQRNKTWTQNHFRQQLTAAESLP